MNYTFLYIDRINNHTTNFPNCMNNYGKLKKIEFKKDGIILNTTTCIIYIDNVKIEKEDISDIINQNIKNIKVGRLKNINKNESTNDWTWRNLDINNGFSDAISIISNKKTKTFYFERTDLSCEFEEI